MNAEKYERLFLGSVLLGVGHESDIDPVDFGNREYSELWAAMRDMTEPDIPALQSRFGDGMLSELVSHGMTAMNAEKVTGHIKEAAHRRRIAFELHRAQIAIEGGGGIAEAESAVIEAFAGSRSTHDAKDLRDLCVESYLQIEHVANHGGSVNFEPTGMLSFDRAVSGLQKEGLIIVAGRPSMGKTAFCNRLARAFGERGPALMASLEMSGTQLALRFQAAEFGVDMSRMDSGGLDADDWRKLAAAQEALKRCRIFINDRAGRSIASVAAEARRLTRKHGRLSMLLIDYLGLLSMDDSETKNEAVSKVTQQCKALAKELKCPVVLLSQLNRSLETRKNKRPMMSDLRDSGAIEQDADQVIFLYRDEYYNKQSQDAGIAEVIMGKNRNGKTGVVRMRWNDVSTSFADLHDDF